MLGMWQVLVCVTSMVSLVLPTSKQATETSCLLSKVLIVHCPRQSQRWPYFLEILAMDMREVGTHILLSCHPFL